MMLDHTANTARPFYLFCVPQKLRDVDSTLKKELLYETLKQNVSNKFHLKASKVSPSCVLQYNHVLTFFCFLFILFPSLICSLSPTLGSQLLSLHSTEWIFCYFKENSEANRNRWSIFNENTLSSDWI